MHPILLLHFILFVSGTSGLFSVSINSLIPNFMPYLRKIRLRKDIRAPLPIALTIHIEYKPL
jgi:hypothetical protein